MVARPTYILLAPFFDVERCEMDAGLSAGVSEDNETVMGTDERGEG